MPERQFSIEQYLADVDKTCKRYGRCVVAVSEGVWATKDEKGKKIPLVAEFMRRFGRERRLTRWHTMIQWARFCMRRLLGARRVFERQGVDESLIWRHMRSRAS